MEQKQEGNSPRDLWRLGAMRNNYGMLFNFPYCQCYNKGLANQTFGQSLRPNIRPNLRQPKNSNIRPWQNLWLEPKVWLNSKHLAKFGVLKLTSLFLISNFWKLEGEKWKIHDIFQFIVSQKLFACLDIWPGLVKTSGFPPKVRLANQRSGQLTKGPAC